MQQQTIQGSANALLKEFKRNVATSSADDALLQAIADATSCVHVDQQYLQENLSGYMNAQSKDPFSAILKLFGLQIVKRDVVSEMFEVQTVEPKNQLDSFLVLDQEQFNENLCKANEQIMNQQQKQQESQENDVQQTNELILEINQLKRDMSQLQTESHSLEESVLQTLQFVLAQQKKQPQNTVEKEIETLLQLMDITIVWSAEDQTLSKTALFTILKTDDLTIETEKPSFVRQGKVVLKGLLFETLEEK